MRFCTSELKVAVISQNLIKRFPGQRIISISGIRREESANRAKAPISAPQVKLTSKRNNTSGLDWHPILDWTIEEVFACLHQHNVRLHEAYTKYGSTRVSCAFCILGSQHDLKASATCADNHEIYREIVKLETDSTFSFQAGKWLGDLAPELLDTQCRTALADAKKKRPAASNSKPGFPNTCSIREAGRLSSPPTQRLSYSRRCAAKWRRSSASGSNTRTPPASWRASRNSSRKEKTNRHRYKLIP